MTLTDSIFQRTDLLASRIQEELVLFDPNIGKYFSTGPVGADIWEYLSSPKSTTQIIEHLLSKYEISQITCEMEVSSFIEQLLAAGLVKQVP